MTDASNAVTDPSAADAAGPRTGDAVRHRGRRRVDGDDRTVARGRSSSVGDWIAAAVLALLAAALLWYRLGPVTRSIVWAEDSGRFLNERLQLGPVASLLHHYEGYLHLVPRIVVDVAVAISPIEAYSTTIAALSCAITGLVCAAVWLLARDVVRAPALRAVLALVPVVTPLVPVEIGGNTANLHWYMLFLAPWVFAFRPRSWWSSAALTIVALVITLTEIQAALFLPLFLLHLRNVRSAPVVVAGALGVGAQLLTAVLYPRTDTHGNTGLVDLLAGFFAQPVAAMWDPDVHRVGAEILAHGWWVVLAPGAVLIALLVLTLFLRGGDARWMAVALVVAPVAVWVAALTVNNGLSTWTTFTAAQFDRLSPYRYAAAASMFLLAAVVVVADTFIARRGIVLPTVGWLLVAGVVATSVLNVHVPTRREERQVPPWSTQVQQARPGCEETPDGSATVRAAPGVPKWDAVLPCALVLSDGGALVLR
ncbi:hypothetical protein [Curtobacterium sp. ME26]|uniref:hypothetical protein n=1 Tax=Curtobacterium sp. ME26 TaxID=2744254 RepID=UPI0015F5BBB5|nr:hypothetical protein [Curtobacterium sp. ME26]